MKTVYSGIWSTELPTCIVVGTGVRDRQLPVMMKIGNERMMKEQTEEMIKVGTETQCLLIRSRS